MKFYFLIMLLILSNNLNAELFVKKKVRFATCEERVKTGNFKGAGMYTLYNQNNEPFQKYCQEFYYESCKELYDNSDIRISGVYEIIHNEKQYPVYCNMTDNGGGWTMVVAQYENNPIQWDEGIQPDYDPSLSTQQSFALSNEEIPNHNEISYGQDLNLKENIAFNYVYQTGNIDKTAIINNYNNDVYYIHRDKDSYYLYHDPESNNNPSYSQSTRHNSLAIDLASARNYDFAFTPENETPAYRGYSYNGNRIQTQDNEEAWVIWVR